MGKRSLFKPLTKTYPNNKNPHWFYFTVNNTSNTGKNLIFKYEQIFADSPFVYYSTEGTVKQIDSPQSWKIPTAERPYPYIRYPIFSLKLLPHTSYTIWAKLIKRDGNVLKLPFSIWESNLFFTYYNDENLFRGFFYGWLCLVSVFSFVLFIFLKERIHLYYNLNVLFLILILATTGGTVNQIGWFLPSNIAGSAGNSFFNMPYTVFNLSFTVLYVGFSYLPKWLLILTRFYSIVSIVLFLALIGINDFYYIPTITALFSYFSIIYVVLILFLLTYGVLRKSTGAKFYLAAVIPLFISSMCYWSASLGIISYNEWIITGFKVSVLIEIFIMSIGLGYHYFNERQEKQRIQKKLIESQMQEIQTQESERRRNAADLHDDLGGTLATIRRRIADIRQNLKDPKTAKDIELLEPLIQKSSDDLRRISHNLMPPEFAHLGLANALQQFIRQIPSAPTYFEFLIFGVETKLPIDTELNIYRIVSELVQNVLKHAQATKAAVQLLYFDDMLSITVEDNGLGNQLISDLNEIAGSSSGIGLKNSKLRAEYIGANLRMETSAGGTLVILEIPYLLAGNDATSHKNTPDRRSQNL